MVVTGEGGYEDDCKDGGEGDCKDGGEGGGGWLLIIIMICLFQFIFMVVVHGPWWDLTPGHVQFSTVSNFKRKVISKYVEGWKRHVGYF